MRYLKPGAKLRVNDSQLVSFNGKAYMLYDFREKQAEVYEPKLSLFQRLAIAFAQREADERTRDHIEPPTEGAMYHPKDWPLEARVWFYKAGINNDDIERLGAFWNANMARVVVPYTNLDGTPGWIARDPFWTKEGAGTRPRPKYLFPAGVSRHGGAVFMPKGVEVGYVITEDVLSAYRVARDTSWAAVSAQGVSLDRDAIVELASYEKPIRVWLDPDSWGRGGADMIAREFSRLGTDVKIIRTERDPKLYEPAAIREVLEA